MVANNWVMQFLADVLGKQVERPIVTETTALGAAYLAGLGTGFYGSLDEISRNWQRDRGFEPGMDAPRRDALYAGWQEAVERTRSKL
jgi:glycerol kinase